MLRLDELRLPLDHGEEDLPRAIARGLGVEPGDITSFEIVKRSYDARKRHQIKLIYSVEVETPRQAEILERSARQGASNNKIRPAPDRSYRFIVPAHGAAHDPDPRRREEASRPVVIGMGPCGLFAGLILAQMGYRPLILERGKAVRERTVDTFALWRKGRLDPESNVQFGEGGAGTFSDGKLYSQVRDPKHYGRKVLQEFVKAGAPEEILFVNKPHIGTFKLVKMLERMRAEILSLGGEIRFGARVTDFLVEDGRLRGLELGGADLDGGELAGAGPTGGEQILADRVILAIGHSARDTFEVLVRRGAHVRAKPFSIGFRVEHPQSLIDARRFGKFAGHPKLGAADYKLVHHCANGRSVYSFCMCPGGTVVAAASEPGRVVTNGMSQYDRSERNANAGIVVSITPDDYPGFTETGNPLAGVELQRQLESLAFELGGETYEAPGQLIGDFLSGRPSTSFGAVLPSYKPGVRLGDLSSALPPYAIAAIREALPVFDKKIPGFAMPDALLTGVETRTSSPLRIDRHDDGHSLAWKGLFPAGEGAGFAGGILSAAIDGIRAAEAVALDIEGH